MFSNHPKTNYIFSTSLNFSSANAFKLDKSKILLFVKELTDDKILDLKAYAEDNLSMNPMMKFVSNKVENSVVKEKKCWLPAFFPCLARFFYRLLPRGQLNARLWGKRLTIYLLNNKTLE